LAGRSPGNEKLSKNELEDNIYQLVVAHNNLAKLVRPATPRDILPLVNESVKSRFWRFIGPVQLLRRMMFVNILFIIAFMVIPLSKYVDGTSGDPLHCDGWPLLINELYFLSAAGIGASFFILFKMNHYIVNNKYHHPDRFVLADASTGRIIGGQGIGEEGVAARVNLISLAIKGGMNLHDLYEAELAYCPAVSEAYDPVSKACEFAIRKMK